MSIGEVGLAKGSPTPEMVRAKLKEMQEKFEQDECLAFEELDIPSALEAAIEIVETIQSTRQENSGQGKDVMVRDSTTTSLSPLIFPVGSNIFKDVKETLSAAGR